MPLPRLGKRFGCYTNLWSFWTDLERFVSKVLIKFQSICHLKNTMQILLTQ
jgi:hypothetical protein